jgi:hypothetical protein
MKIKIEAAAPQHQEMNGVCESKWKQVHLLLVNMFINNACLGGAFFHVIDKFQDATTACIEGLGHLVCLCIYCAPI